MIIKTGTELYFDINNLNKYNTLKHEVNDFVYIAALALILKPKDFVENNKEFTVEYLLKKINNFKQNLKEKSIKNSYINRAINCLENLLKYYDKNSIMKVDIDKIRNNSFFNKPISDFANFSNDDCFTIEVERNICNFIESGLLGNFPSLEDCYVINTIVTPNILKKLGLEKRNEKIVVYEILIKTSNDASLIREELLNSTKHLFLNLKEDLSNGWVISENQKRFTTNCYKLFYIKNKKDYISTYEILSLLQQYKKDLK